jgi:hypothetical protein
MGDASAQSLERAASSSACPLRHPMPSQRREDGRFLCRLWLGTTQTVLAPVYHWLAVSMCWPRMERHHWSAPGRRSGLSTQRPPAEMVLPQHLLCYRLLRRPPFQRDPPAVAMRRIDRVYRPMMHRGTSGDGQSDLLLQPVRGQRQSLGAAWERHELMQRTRLTACHRQVCRTRRSACSPATGPRG